MRLHETSTTPFPKTSNRNRNPILMGAGQMAPGLRMHPFLPWDPGAVPSPNWQLTATYNSSSQGNAYLFQSMWAPAHTCCIYVHADKTLVCIKCILKAWSLCYIQRCDDERPQAFTWKKKFYFTATAEAQPRGLFLFLLRFGCHARKAISFTPEGMQRHGYMSHAWFSRRI